jgi:2-polyprenyl-6-methoxyphenol hydroxylase-like FAD-dependent oxidoreductase
MEVMVVGAGPVGLTMAGELARHGVRRRVIDGSTSRCPAVGRLALRRAHSRWEPWASRAR